MTRTAIDTVEAFAAGDPQPPPPHRRAARRIGAAARPWAMLALVALGVALAGVPGYHPENPVAEYAVRATVVGFAAAGAASWWWSVRHRQVWGFDLIPALLGGIGGLALVGALNGTPYAPGGLAGDQTFRTAAITRFADTWQGTDFTFQGLPAFYAPAYFWVLGRAADLTGTEPWRMAKVGTIAVALLVPVLTYLLWRRLVPAPVAALLAAVPLLVENFYEPYAWIVLFAIVPWWLEAVHGLRRPGRPPGNVLFLGVVGGLLFMTYYYFFFLAAIALVLHIVVERLLGTLRWRQLGRAAAALGIAAAVSAVYWLPLAVSLLRAEHPESLANRWFNTGHAQFPLPMLTSSVTGVIALLGLAFLVWTVRREPLSRGLLIFAAAGYSWYVLGAVAAVADSPLLSFRGKPLIPMVLLIGGVLALVRLAQFAATRLPTPDVRRVAMVLGVLLLVYAGQSMVTSVRDSELMEEAHATALPDRPPPEPPPAALHRAIEDRFGPDARPVLLSDRVDLLVLYPYHGFLQWNAHYAHPAAEFRERVEFLSFLAESDSPHQLAARARDNRFDPIDGYVLTPEGEELVYRFSDDNFPSGLTPGEVRFPAELLAPGVFEVMPMGEVVLAFPR